MSSEAAVAGEQARARPLSGGLWTLLSWLRREDRSSSSDSLSSAGSDRTAVSFAFLASPPQRNRSSPLPPLSPPTDSYRKRVHDGNRRRQNDRNLTLHRKYGLYYGYDAFSLPPARKHFLDVHNEQDRDRRANSESLPRRAAYVPGKRRAPLPPARPHSVISTASLTRRQHRKRPAPQPPVNFTEKAKENIEASGFEKIDIIVQMDQNSHRERRPLSNVASNDCRSEKKAKESNSKETKNQKEKSFLKQIFENKKRNSTVESVPERILPSISELDKQAAEIIKSCKLKPVVHNNNNSDVTEEQAWFCTRCLRRYDSTIVTCQYCLPEQKRLSTLLGNNHVNKNAVSRGIQNNNCSRNENVEVRNLSSTNRISGIGADEKQKLKEMLKEMKDSLPKKQNNDKDKNIFTFDSTGRNSSSLETPTLRIESKVTKKDKNYSIPQPSTSKQINKNIITNITEITNMDKILPKIEPQPVTENVVITQHVVLVAPETKDNSKLNISKKHSNVVGSNSVLEYGSKVNDNAANKSTSNVRNNNIHTPLKISSLLNPVYIPKSSVCEEHSPKSLFFTQNKELTKNINNSTEKSVQQDTLQPTLNSPSSESQLVLTTMVSEANTSKISEAKFIKLTKLDQQATRKTKTNEEIIKPNPIMPILEATTNSSFPNVSTSVNTSTDGTKAILDTKEAIIKRYPIIPILKTTTNSSFSSSVTSASTATDGTKVISETKGAIIKPNPIIPILKTTTTSSFPSASTSANTLTDKTKVDTKETITAIPTLKTTTNSSFASTSTSGEDKTIIHSNMAKFTVDQHSRRRDLINQLEQSIAKGDERAAADAAVKLAQLRLSCSVLSYSSQIMAQTPGAILRTEKESPSTVTKTERSKVETAKPYNKVNVAVQSVSTVPPNNLLKNKDLYEDVDQSQKKAAEVQVNKVTATKNIAVQLKTPDEDKAERRQKLLSPEPSTSKQIINENGSNLTTIQVWVEDREATRGPVRLRVPRQAVMGDLRRQAETSLGLVGPLQRWIVGRALCTDDRTSLVSLAGPDLSAPFYLCVVETESDKAGHEAEVTSDQINLGKASDVYSELVQLEQRALVVNAEPFECGICMEDCAAGGGAVLRECVHMFCRDCLSDVVKHCEEPVVGCPSMGCPGVLQEREIRALVNQNEYERWLARGLAAAESGTRNAFHCRTRDCTGWALCDPEVQRFPCPVCKHNNCIPCQAIHERETCEQYRKNLQETASTTHSSQADEGTQALLETLISKGEALECPECRAIITKKWGCDWVKCSACKTEICWVTRGRRWGPGGKGDTSGGCRCGVDGKRCHPSCGYCH